MPRALLGIDRPAFDSAAAAAIGLPSLRSERSKP